MEVERNQFSLLLREAYSCLSLWFEYVHTCGCVGEEGGILSLSLLFLSLLVSLFLSICP